MNIKNISNNIVVENNGIEKHDSILHTHIIDQINNIKEKISCVLHFDKYKKSFHNTVDAVSKKSDELIDKIKYADTKTKLLLGAGAIIMPGGLFIASVVGGKLIYEHIKKQNVCKV